MSNIMLWYVVMHRTSARNARRKRAVSETYQHGQPLLVRMVTVRLLQRANSPGNRNF